MKIVPSWEKLNKELDKYAKSGAGNKWRPDRNDLWTNENIFTHYEAMRRIFRFLNKKIVQDILNQYVRIKNPTIIEIGAGAGEMSKLLPEELKAQVIQTERTGRFSGINAVNNQEAKIVNADVYHLPFADNSADVVAGFAMFDVLEDPAKAAAEIKRVLKINGKFIHFLDMEHNDNVLFDDFAKQGKVVFPSSFGNMPIIDLDNDPGEASFCSAPKKEIEKALKKIKDEDLKHLIQNYLKNPWEEYTRMRELTGFYQLNKAIMALNKEKVLFPAIYPARHFQEKMQNVFEGEGFKILENHKVSSREFISENDERAKMIRPGYNFVRNKIGRIVMSARGKNIPIGHINIESIMHVIVVEKQ